MAMADLDFEWHRATERMLGDGPPGVYVILCNPTLKCYVGSSFWTHGRVRSHLNALRRDVHSNRYLQHAWDKHGPGAFQWAILEVVEAGDLDRDGHDHLLGSREAEWCTLLNEEFNLATPAILEAPDG